MDERDDLADGVEANRSHLRADSVGLALLVVLETLNPAERFAFVLHDAASRARPPAQDVGRVCFPVESG
jgi:hypothetical protein